MRKYLVRVIDKEDGKSRSVTINTTLSLKGIILGFRIWDKPVYARTDNRIVPNPDKDVTIFSAESKENTVKKAKIEVILSGVIGVKRTSRTG